MAELIGGQMTPGEALLIINQEMNVLNQERIGLERRLKTVYARLEVLKKSKTIAEGYQEEEI